MKSKSTIRQTIAQESEILTFGKFKYCTVQHILRKEPSYILWMNAEKIVKFPQEIVDKATDLVFDATMNAYVDATFGHNFSSYYDD